MFSTRTRTQSASSRRWPDDLNRKEQQHEQIQDHLHARAIRNYLYQMQEQLQYVLCNLDVENMSEPLRARLNSIQ